MIGRRVCFFMQLSKFVYLVENKCKNKAFGILIKQSFFLHVRITFYRKNYNLKGQVRTICFWASFGSCIIELDLFNGVGNSNKS